MRLLAIVFFSSTLAGLAAAQEDQVLKKTTISGWKVAKYQTPSDGLSCQAYKCNVSACDVDSADAVVRLWGSKRRNAVTPMIGLKVTRTGAKDAALSVSGRSFPLTQAKNSRGKLFIAEKPTDDAEIVRLMARSPSNSVEFSSEKGSAAFRLTGIKRVLGFFEKECGITR